MKFLWKGFNASLRFNAIRECNFRFARYSISKSKSFKFDIGVSGMAKGNQKTLKNNDLSEQVGEDAYFHRQDAIGVADGVGGWCSVKNADPALFSRRLLYHISSELEKYDDLLNEEISCQDYYNIDPRKIIQQGLNLLIQETRDLVLGSTTVLIGVLREEKLKIANIGDCRLLLIRNGICIYRTLEQVHSFNFPFQLGTGSKDSPADAFYDEISIQEGDIVILGTDGLFDNVFDEDIIGITHSICSRKRGLCDPLKLSSALLKKAREVAEDSRKAYSPFQEKAIQEGLYYQGGKMDDITIVVGVVTLQ